MISGTKKNLQTAIVIFLLIMAILFVWLWYLATISALESGMLEVAHYTITMHQQVFMT